MRKALLTMNSFTLPALQGKNQPYLRYKQEKAWVEGDRPFSLPLHQFVLFDDDTPAGQTLIHRK
jgi:hypothetical protein